MNSPSPEVRLSGIDFAYRGGPPVLRDVTVTWSAGVNVLLGLNGAGKTTLLRILTTSLAPGAGDVEFDDGQLPARSNEDLRRRLGYQPQVAEWRPRLSVADFLHYFAWCRKVPSRERGGRVSATLDQVGLVDQAEKLVGALSGGQYRRLLLGQALVHEPSVLVLDEPSAGLDPEQRARFRETVRDLSTDRVVVFSTHVLEDVAQVATRISVLHGAAVTFDGTPDELAERGVSDDRSRRMEEGFLRVVSESAR